MCRVYVSHVNFVKCFLNVGMPDSLASSPRYRNEEKNAFDGISPVTEEGDIQSGTEMLRYWTELPPGCRNADAGAIGLDADAQLWQRDSKHSIIKEY